MCYYLGNIIVFTRTYRYNFGCGNVRRVPIVPNAEKSPNIAICGRGTLEKSMPLGTYIHRVGITRKDKAFSV